MRVLSIALASLTSIACLQAAACSGTVGGPGPDAPSASGDSSAVDPADAASDASLFDAPSDVASEASESPDGATADVDAADAATPDGGKAPPPGIGDCPVLTFPSGAALYTFPDPALSDLYVKHLDGAPPPQCFLDIDRLIDEKSGETLDWTTLQLSAHFALTELVHTEIDGGYSHRVLVSPALVATLESFRTTLGASVPITSGYRSPKHQEDICNAKCGNFYCPGTCGKASRHMFGDAVDLPFPQIPSYADDACTAEFRYVFWEFEHWHFDLDPSKAVCTRASTG